MRSRQLFASVTASIAGTVYFDVPDSTTIRFVTWSINSAPGANLDYVEAEVSMSANAQNATTDAQGIIAIACSNIMGSGSPASLGQGGINTFSPVSCAVKGGTRLYLNVTESGTGTHRVRALVWFD